MIRIAVASQHQVSLFLYPYCLNSLNKIIWGRGREVFVMDGSAKCQNVSMSAAPPESNNVIHSQSFRLLTILH